MFYEQTFLFDLLPYHFYFFSVTVFNIFDQKMSKGDGVVFSKKRRFRYTFLEERKMWHFFVRELKAQNPDALHKRIALWGQYEQEEQTNKKMFGLESHFRKYMLPRINQASVRREDLFLLLRFFLAQLNASQRNELEQLHGCEIECEMDGTFVRARIENEEGAFFYPTAEQENTILRSLEEDESGDNETNDLRTEAQSVSVVADSAGDENLDEEEQQNNHANNNRDIKNRSGGWISKSALFSRPPPQHPRKKKRTDRNTPDIVLGNDAAEIGQERDTPVIVLEDGTAEIGQERETPGIVLEESTAEIGQEQERDTIVDALGPGNTLPLACSTPQRVEKQAPDQSSDQRRSSALPQLVSPGHCQSEVAISRQSNIHVETATAQSASAKLKRHFLDGALKFLDGNMDLESFVRPFAGSKFEKGARAISWLSEKHPRHEFQLKQECE